ncbi:MAG: four-helix bundle copper-binding protein, partial [Undibacterium umbellatum]|uniref:four-helix bundle copper-binding protein n=1 Tax=Undibacterium umbellatum TaxID=2762300 RepID=UPI003BB4943D
MNMNDMQSCIDACIDACNKCYQTCLQTAMNHCLDTGGKHVEPAHFRLMMNCAQICQTSVDLQLSGSAFCGKYCSLCAEVCEACADSCAELDEM